MAKLPTLFLPGLLCDEAIWAPQIAALQSDGPVLCADLTQDDTIAAMAARAIGLVRGRCAIVALSMGGYVAFEILRRWPERVASVALFDTSAAPDTAQKATERRAAIDMLALGRFLGVTRHLLPQLIHPIHFDGPVAATVQAMALRVGGDAFRRQQQAILGRDDARPGLAAIRVPTLVAVGREDRLTPLAEAEAIHRAIPDARLHVFERCGHLPPLESPDAVTAVLEDWLHATWRPGDALS